MKKAVPVMILALLVVFFSWVTWHFLGQDAFHWYLGAVAFLIIAFRIRSRLKQLQKPRI